MKDSLERINFLMLSGKIAYLTKQRFRIQLHSQTGILERVKK
jgi:hypothetical protein